jgi:hypothetical protein
MLCPEIIKWQIMWGNSNQWVTTHSMGGKMVIVKYSEENRNTKYYGRVSGNATCGRKITILHYKRIINKYVRIGYTRHVSLQSIL